MHHKRRAKAAILLRSCAHLKRSLPACGFSSALHMMCPTGMHRTSRTSWAERLTSMLHILANALQTVDARHRQGWGRKVHMLWSVSQDHRRKLSTSSHHVLSRCRFLRRNVRNGVSYAPARALPQRVPALSLQGRLSPPV